MGREKHSLVFSSAVPLSLALSFQTPGRGCPLPPGPSRLRWRSCFSPLPGGSCGLALPSLTGPRFLAWHRHPLQLCSLWGAASCVPRPRLLPLCLLLALSNGLVQASGPLPGLCDALGEDPALSPWPLARLGVTGHSAGKGLADLSSLKRPRGVWGAGGVSLQRSPTFLPFLCLSWAGLI